MVACGVPWSIVALVLGVLGLLVVGLWIFAANDGEFTLWISDSPEDH
jgi:hypothetical protein